MKKLLLIMFSVLVIFFQSNLIAQSEEEAIPGEFHIAFTNLPSSWAFTVKINSIGTVWDHYHYLSDEYPGGEVYYSSSSTPNTNWWHASALSWFSPPHEPILSLGLYEIGIWESQTKRAWFYLDYRTSHLPEASTLQTLDLKFNYDVTNKGFELVYPIAFSGSVINGTYYPIWELIDSVELRSVGFEDYWQNSLVLIPSTNNKPFLIWGPYPGDQQITEISYYEIWRKYGSQDWSYLDYVNGNTFIYEDEELNLAGQQSGTTVFYKIRAAQTALPENLLSNYSNVTSTVVSGEDPEKKNVNYYGTYNLSSDKYELYQNYPNPFNPKTTIFYRIPVDNFVTMKVYDVMGSEIAILVNDLKDAGTHSIEFDASGLSSGIYFYKIQTNNYVESRKLILQK